MSRLQMMGEKELIRKLEQLSKPSRARAAARGSIAEGAKILNRSIKDSVPSGNPNNWRELGGGKFVRESDMMKGIKKSIGRRKRTYARDNTVFEAIGPRYEYQHEAPFARSSTGAGAEELRDGAGRFRSRDELSMTSFHPSLAAPNIEHGTVRHSPVPFMRPGFARADERAMRAIGSSLGKHIEKQAAKG